MVFHPLYEKLQSIASITTIIFNKKILHEKCAKYALLWRIQHVELKTNLKVSRSGSNNEYPWINIYHVKGQIYLFEFGHCHVQHVLNSMVLKSILQWAAMISIQTKKKIYMCDFKISSITKNKKKNCFLMKTAMKPIDKKRLLVLCFVLNSCPQDHSEQNQKQTAAIQLHNSSVTR